jgi:hypothetical protein
MKFKKREKQLIDGITKHSQKLQNEIEMERKTVKQTFCDLKRQADQQVNILTSVADELIALNASPLNFYISFTEFTKFWILCSFN